MIQLTRGFGLGAVMASRDTFTATVPQEIIEAEEFTDWLDELDGSLFSRVEAALELIRLVGTITLVKDLGDGLYEKKWNNGLRLYFSVIEKQGRKTLLLLGSGKGREQSRAIEKAKAQLARYQVSRETIRKKD